MEKFDVGIIGAGLAGMSLAIQLADAGKRVLIAEQHSFPKHKVCGEFLSKESLPFLRSLGLDLLQMNLPHIHQFLLSSEKGGILKADLDVGGIGISRYALDEALSQQLDHPNIHFMTNCKVEDVKKGEMIINSKPYSCKLIVAAYGKYTPHFSSNQNNTSKNYVGVKYHIKYEHEADQIALHTFKGGYCGISKIENGSSCLCYLIEADVLKDKGGIKAAEAKVLSKNEYLAQIFKNASFLFEAPLTISNIQFRHKHLIDDKMLYAGDSAGAISPLSGNGMSMALHASKLLANTIINKPEDLESYRVNWMKEFSGRVKKAGLLNNILLEPALSQAAITLLNIGPQFLKQRIVRSMQGSSF